MMGGDNPNGHNGFDGLFNCQLRKEDFFLGKKEKKALGRDEGCRDENGDLLLALEIHQFIRHKAEHIISFLWKFNKDSLAKRTPPSSREGVGQLFGGKVDILDHWNGREETIPPTDQLTAEKIGSDHSRQVE